MNKNHLDETGFTLIELIVVLVIMGGFLFFAIPKLHNFNMFSGRTQALGKTVRLIESLKARAVTHNKDYLMHLDLDAGLVWVSDETMDEEQAGEAKTGAVQFSGNTMLLGVEFPSPLPLDINKNTDEFLIRFYKQGYSDMALIHLRAGDNDFTIMVEPFISKVELYESVISFDRCLE
ncbi:MAG: type II secretion system protein [Desulfobacterium sp.]|nr:type II secretion system protein [Desulfobacterium sp.]